MSNQKQPPEGFFFGPPANPTSLGDVWIGTTQPTPGALAAMTTSSTDPHSAMYCEHANECPSVCPCEPDCFCRRGTVAHGGPCRTARSVRPPKAVDAAAEIARGAASVFDDGGRGVASVGVQRVKIETKPGMPQFGVFLGLLTDERNDMLAVVRPDNYGLMLKAVHPSYVTPVTPEEEAAYKP